MSTEQQAKLLEEIAAVMRERPEDWWLEFERRWHAPDCVGAWIPARGSGQVWIALHDSEWEVRRRPRTITIAGIEVPEPMREAPPKGANIYIADLLKRALVTCSSWDGTRWDFLQLQRGHCHLTREAAQQHARALIIASGGKVE